MKKRWMIFWLVMTAYFARLLGQCALYLWQTYDTEKIFVSLFEIYFSELLLAFVAGAVLVLWELRLPSVKYRRMRLVFLLSFYLFFVLNRLAYHIRDVIPAYYTIGQKELPPPSLAVFEGMLGWWIQTGLALAGIIGLFCYIVVRVKDGKAANKTDDVSVS